MATQYPLVMRLNLLREFLNSADFTNIKMVDYLPLNLQSLYKCFYGQCLLPYLGPDGQAKLTQEISSP